jgi:hypothetical protein
MKKILIPIVCIGMAISARAESLFDQLVTFNPNWQSYETQLDFGSSMDFESDREYIQTHLTNVLQILRSNATEQLTCVQLNTRSSLIDVLESYKDRGLFPMNYYRQERIPVFIDEHNTHCAVGYLLMETGYDDVAHRISAKNNYVWVKDIDDAVLPQLQAFSGFTIEEIKLIQGAYDFYDPYARTKPNRMEIPQAPAVVSMNFEGKNVEVANNQDLKSVWYYGEGKDSVLHGKWVQNYRVGIPWIEGYFENGNRTGSWKEYYQGTTILCRTEHWRNDKLNGVRTRYDRQGNIIERITFKDGEAVQKINYDLQGDIEWVRKPIDSITLQTEAYSLTGYLLAKGKEQISNPSGRLQWFQDIELTALNTFAITARDGAPGYTESGMPVYSNQIIGSNNFVSHIEYIDSYAPIQFGGSFNQGPGLVNYIKVGEWKYYNEFTAESYSAPAESSVDYLNKDFPHFGVQISTQLQNTDIECLQQSFDSLQVQYASGRIQDLKGYSPEAATRFGVILNEEQPIFYGFAEYQGLGRKQYPTIKEMGELNENGYRIGEWVVYDIHGKPSRYIKYIQPFKKEEPRTGSL